METNYKPLIMTSEMEDTNKWYEGHPEFKVLHFTEESILKSNVIHMDNISDKINMILEFIDNNAINREDMKIFDTILHDQDLLEKLTFVTDGSFLSHRIYYKNAWYLEHAKFEIGSSWLFKNDRAKYEELSSDKIAHIMWIKENFEKVFIHLISDDEAQRSHDIIFGAYTDWDDDDDGIRDDPDCESYNC